MTTDTPRTEAAKPKLTRESYDENWNMKQTDTPATEESSVAQKLYKWPKSCFHQHLWPLINSRFNTTRKNNT